MNILIISNSDGTGGYPDFTAREFRRQGHRCYQLGIDGTNPSRVFNRLRKSGYGFSLAGRRLLEWQIKQRIRRYDIDLLLLYGSNYFLYPSAIKRLKNNGVKVVLWEGNLQFSQGFQHAAILNYDLIIVTDSYIVPYLRNVMGHPRVEYLKGNAVPEEFYPPEMDEQEFRPYRADVSFVGKYFPNREDYLSRIDRPVRIWGTQWHRSRVFKDSDIVPLDESKKNLVFAASKINLNFRAGNQQVNNFSSRIWEIPLSGGFVLSEESHDLLSCFKEDREIAVFRGPKDAREKIDYYLEHDGERQEMCHQLRTKIMNQFLLKDTVAKFVDHINRL